MKIRLAECDYEFLRPPKDVFNVTHTDHYIKHGEGKKAVRKIFEDVKYPEDELEKLREFEALVAKENIALPANWTKTDNIKMMFAGKFDFKKCIKVMRLHTEWRASPDRGIINPAAYKMLHDGILYISGRDKQYRPIIILNAYKIDLKTMDLSALIEALSFVLDTCIKFYFVPGKVENWVFIIETNGAGIINFPFKVVKSVNDATSVNYTSRLDKLYIMNPSSFLGASWKMVHSFLDPETASKIFMLKKSEFGKLLETIAPNQLEKRYGGTLELSAPFWPPVNTLGQPPYTVELMKEIEATKAQAVEAMKVQELVNLQHEEVKHEVKHEVQDQGARSKRNSVSYGIERNSPEIVIKAENSSPAEQRFAKMARPGSPGEEESLSMSPDTKKQKQILTDAKELIGTSPIQGMIRENVRRSSKQLDVEHKEQKEQPSYTVNVQHAKTLEANAFEEERYLGEGERDSSKKKVQVKSGVTFVGVDGHDVDDKQETSRRENGIVLEGQGSFRNEFCGFCRPKVKNDEQAAQESSSCSMF